MNNKKIIFMGSPKIASDYLEALIKSNFIISAVFSQPPKKKSRGMKIIESEVHQIANKNNIEVFCPNIFDKDTIETVKKLNPDLIIVMAYGKILPKDILDLPPFGCINIHVSLLPRWRGAAPIEHSLMNGDKETGISIIKLIEKLDAGEFDCIILAAAGLKRLGFESRIHQIIPSEVSLHAVGQGALGIECKSDDKKVLEIINILEDKPTSQRCLAERSFLRELEGGCQVPIGVNSKIKNEQLCLTGMVASLDGERLIKDQYIGHVNDPEQVGKELAKKLKLQGAGKILSEIFEQYREN